MTTQIPDGYVAFDRFHVVVEIGKQPRKKTEETMRKLVVADGCEWQTVGLVGAEIRACFAVNVASSDPDHWITTVAELHPLEQAKILKALKLKLSRDNRIDIKNIWFLPVKVIEGDDEV